MDLIVVVKKDDAYFFYELDYAILLNLDLFHDRSNSLDALDKWTIHIVEISEDYNSLSEQETTDSLIDFLPTVFVDVELKSFYNAHPDSYYLRLSRCLSKSWNYYEIDEVLSLVPEELRYWSEWVE